MSKKNKKNASETNAFNETELSANDKNGRTTESKPRVSAANDHKTSKFAGRLAYLKNHWWLVGIIALFSLGALGASLKYLEADAARQMQNGQLSIDNKDQASLLNKINPFLPAPPAPQLSKENIYAGGRMVAVVDKDASENPPITPTPTPTPVSTPTPVPTPTPTPIPTPVPTPTPSTPTPTPVPTPTPPSCHPTTIQLRRCADSGGRWNYSICECVPL